MVKEFEAAKIILGVVFCVLSGTVAELHDGFDILHAKKDVLNNSEFPTYSFSFLF